ncbi:hypothetical protein V6Z12_A10G114200 [Gossypium hirsutum]
MAWTAKFLVPFRQSFSQSRHLFNGKIRPLKTWVHIFEPKLQSRASKFEYMLNIQRKYVQDCCFSGLDIFSDDNHLESFDASEVITRILLFLLSTKPSPSSIYLFIEKLCYGYMRQKPHFYKCKALHASKVEVQDYKLFCLAIVEIGDEKIRLIGILGGWWSLPSSLGLYFLAPEQSSSSSL